MAENSLIEKLKKYPSGASALGLGIVGLGSAWEGLGYKYGESIFLGTILISLVLVITYISKIIFCYSSFLDDIQDTMRGAVVTSLDMAILIISTYVYRYNPEIGRLIWFIASLVHLIIWFTFTYYRIKLGKLLEFHFGWFVTYGGIITVAVTAKNMGFDPWAKSFWWIGLISVIALLPIIIIRGIRLGFENKYKITIPVVAAPVNLLLAGYLSGIFEVNQTVACLLAIAAFTGTFTAWIGVLRAKTLTFAPTFAAFTFPLTISVTAATRFGKLYPSFSFIAWIEIIITTISVLYTIYRFSEFYFFKKD